MTSEPMTSEARHHAAVRWLALGSLLVAGIGAGTVDGDQCAVDGDCAALLGVAPEQAQCVLGVCGRRTTALAAGDGGAERSCQTTKDCTAEGDTAFCREGRCVPILTGGISEVSQNYIAGDPIFIGALAPINLEVPGGTVESVYDKIRTDGIRLASDDWNAATAGAVTVGAARRAISLAICDTNASLDKLNSCFDAMTTGLRAPIVLVSNNEEVETLLPRALERDVVLYCTDCEPSRLPIQNTEGHVWFGFPSVKVLSPIRTRWLERLEAQVRGERLGPLPAKFKVAVVGAQSLVSLDTLVGGVTFNGQSAAQNQAAGTLLTKIIDDNAPSDYRALADELAAFGPDVIIVANLGRLFHFYVMPEIEARWPRDAKGSPLRPLPRYLTSAQEAYAFRFERSVGANDDLRRRVTGVQYHSSDPKLDENQRLFFGAFRASTRFGYDPANIGTGFESFYVASFAIAAGFQLSSANPAALRGRDVIAALRRLSFDAADPGALVDVRANEIARGLTLLAGRQRIDLRGLQSSLDWDPATGEVAADAAIYCVKRDGAFSLGDVWIYDARTKQPVGEPKPDVCGL